VVTVSGVWVNQKMMHFFQVIISFIPFHLKKLPLKKSNMNVLTIYMTFAKKKVLIVGDLFYPTYQKSS